MTTTQTCAPGDACCPPPATAPGETQADRDLALVAKAIGHPLRIRILRMLASTPGCVCGSIVEQFDTPQSTISQHLKVLAEAGLVQGTIEGRSTCYCLDRGGMKRLRVLVAEL
jgi:ArsR family transcriptional regulator